MAGSYRHITDAENNFTGLDTIDNLKDAYQALEECHAIIRALSGGDRQKIYEAWLSCPECIHPSNVNDSTFDGFWYD